MFAETSTEHSPWELIPGNSKRFARVAVLDAAIRRIEEGMRHHGMEPLEPLR